MSKKEQNQNCRGRRPRNAKNFRTSVGAGHAPPADFAKQNLFTVRRKYGYFPSGNLKIVPIFG
ncbi:MAG: hypothetical protein IJO05_04850, partial [Oscillospiraceae bacterium]|nr:hypothetical protein [Oscillospiraceae bacterium]